MTCTSQHTIRFIIIRHVYLLYFTDLFHNDLFYGKLIRFRSTFCERSSVRVPGTLSQSRRSLRRWTVLQEWKLQARLHTASLSVRLVGRGKETRLPTRFSVFRSVQGRGCFLQIAVRSTKGPCGDRRHTSWWSHRWRPVKDRRYMCVCDETNSIRRVCSRQSSGAVDHRINNLFRVNMMKYHVILSYTQYSHTLSSSVFLVSNRDWVF